MVKQKDSKDDLERAAVIPPPKDTKSFGEMGKPVLLTVSIGSLYVNT